MTLLSDYIPAHKEGYTTIPFPPPFTVSKLDFMRKVVDSFGVFVGLIALVVLIILVLIYIFNRKKRVKEKTLKGIKKFGIVILGMVMLHSFVNYLLFTIDLAPGILKIVTMLSSLVVLGIFIIQLVMYIKSKNKKAKDKILKSMKKSGVILAIIFSLYMILGYMLLWVIRDSIPIGVMLPC